MGGPFGIYVGKKLSCEFGDHKNFLSVPVTYINLYEPGITDFILRYSNK